MPVGIRRDSQEPLHPGLGNQQAVKWIAMDRRQLAGFDLMPFQDGQDRCPSPKALLPKVFR